MQVLIDFYRAPESLLTASPDRCVQAPINRYLAEDLVLTVSPGAGADYKPIDDSFELWKMKRLPMDEWYVLKSEKKATVVSSRKTKERKPNIVPS